jgi:hypothetical protein
MSVRPCPLACASCRASKRFITALCRPQACTPGLTFRRSLVRFGSRSDGIRWFLKVGFRIFSAETCRSAIGQLRSFRFAPKYVIQSWNRLSRKRSSYSSGMVATPPRPCAGSRRASCETAIGIPRRDGLSRHGARAADHSQRKILAFSAPRNRPHAGGDLPGPRDRTPGIVQYPTHLMGGTG